MPQHNFTKLYATNVKTDHDPITVSKWKSDESGLTVYYAQTEDPIVTAYCSIPTEAFDDDGIPHCLEHLIFMGSRQYPYKGLLDKIATRTFTQSNAATDTDHTYFTLNSPGNAVFLVLLPIWLDHVFFPLLTEATFTTEIHHITKDGDDGGVVYAEMQARESQFKLILAEEKLKYMYPGHCGYRFNTGAKLENLRSSTTLEMIRDYHKQYYRPENTHIIVTGGITLTKLLTAISQFEPKLKRLTRNEFTRPWQDIVPPLSTNEEHCILFPSDSEEYGHVYIAWRGPPAIDQYKLSCTRILMWYLGRDACSPLNWKLVSEQRVCGHIECSTHETTVCCMTYRFLSVSTDKLQQVQHLVEQELSRIYNSRELDMQLMKKMIIRRKWYILSQLEYHTSDTIAGMCIGDSLFGDSFDDFAAHLHRIERLEQMEKENADFWLELMKDIFLQHRKVVIIGKPSKTAMESRANAEKQRIKARAARLGPDNLKALGDKLSDAIEKNKEQPPQRLIDGIPVPDVSKIKFRKHHTSSNDDDPHRLTVNENFPLDTIKFKFHLDDVHTNSIVVRAILDTSVLSQRERLYLPLLAELLFELPITRNKIKIPYKAVVAELAEDILSYRASLGLNGGTFRCGKYSHNLVVVLNIERKNYTTGVRWMKELLLYTVFDPTRVKACTDRLLRFIDAKLLNAECCLDALMDELLFTPDCNYYASTIFRQRTFLNQLLRRLTAGEDAVISDLQTIRAKLVKRNNIRIHMVADVELLTTEQGNRPAKPWEDFDRDPKMSSSRQKQSTKRQTWEYLRPLRSLEHRFCIMGSGSIEAEYMVHVTESIKNFEHPDLAALKIMIQYLKQEDGPLWSGLRGSGLVYHFELTLKPEVGLLELHIWPANNVVAAFQMAEQIIMDHCTGKVHLRDVELEGAIITQLYQEIQERRSSDTLSLDSMLAYYRKVSPQYNLELLKKMLKIKSIPSLVNTGLKYFKHLFNNHKTRAAIVCYTNKVDEIKSGFHQMGYHYYVIPNSADCFLNNLSPD